MKSRDSVISLITGLAKKYKNMSFTYGFDSSCRMHVVDVSPTESYGEAEYLLDEVRAVKSFIKDFPDENLVFVSNDPYLKVVSPIIHMSGLSASNQVVFGSSFFSELEFIIPNSSLTLRSTPTDIMMALIYPDRPGFTLSTPITVNTPNSEYHGDSTFAMAA